MYLNCHTHYSYRFGTFSEKVLLAMAQQNGVETLALTDINNTSACLNFIRLAQVQGVKPVVGIDFRDGARQLYVGLARNNEGFQELNVFLSHHLERKLPLPERPPAFEHVYIIFPFRRAMDETLVLMENEYVGVSVADLPLLGLSRYGRYRSKRVVLQPVTFRHQKDFNTHRLLRAIDRNTLLSKLAPSEEASPDERMLPLPELKRLYGDHPDILERTERILADCNVSFDFSDERASQNQRTYTGSVAGDREKIRELCREGLHYRYGGRMNPELWARLDKELELIERMGYISYFLISWDIVQYARSKGYFYVGRGSGANSVVSYLLRITDVDPIELNLYFERFINLFRRNPPDFDIDFSWRDREDVTRYIFERFPNVSLLGAYNTFQYRAAVRELGKVFGLPGAEIDQLADGNQPPGKHDSLHALVLKYAGCMRDLPNHLSIHAGGILIPEKPIHWFCATDLPPKGFRTTHFDMVIAEDVGLFKYDILGQRGLGKIEETLGIIRENRPEVPPIDIHDMDRLKSDSRVNGLIREAQCLGCFYVESPAMRMLLQKLRVDNYLGLVAASSVIRPGVAKSGMMREYILRHQDPKRAEREAHPVMLGLMPETYGVMIYQEDVIKVAHHFAGLSLDEADVLRRGMSGKFRSREEFAKVRAKYFLNCREKGYPDETVRDIWRQIESFAGYAFAKGHSASYAVESYQSLFLKAYYPLEYMVSILNNGGGFYRSEVYVHEARMLGATIHPPCINRSENRSLIRGNDIYLGFHFLKDIEGPTVERILAERERNGPFADLDDFIDRVPIGKEQLALLVRVRAFRFTGIPKRKLLWQAYYRLGAAPPTFYQAQLFDNRSTTRFELPDLPTSPLEEAFDEMELLGFTLCSPFDLLEKPLETGLLARELRDHLGREITIHGYVVTVKNTSTSQGDRMHFGTFLDRAGHFIDTVHFPPSAREFPFRGRGIYELRGKVVDEFGFHSIEVSRMVKMPYIADPRYSIDTPVLKVGPGQ